jgi:hypothetical protein
MLVNIKLSIFTTILEYGQREEKGARVDLFRPNEFLPITVRMVVHSLNVFKKGKNRASQQLYVVIRKKRIESLVKTLIPYPLEREL